MPNLIEKEKCCGCAACVNKCRKSAITMEPDETGFLYPKVNESKCVECGLCEKACPSLVGYTKETNIRSWVIQHKDDEIRRQSTSGGAFTAIAEKVIENGGVVFGATISPSFIVKHIYVDNVKDLRLFRNSKYVQSVIGDTFKYARRFLEEGRQVCFSGTPCQIAGLLVFLKKNYNNLLTIDVSCHAVPSPLIFQKYVNLMKKRYPSADKIVFRDKRRGYSYSTMAWYNSKSNKCIYRASYELDEWLRLFLHDKCDRNSCYDCQFQKYPHAADMTIWDCYNVRELCPLMDDNKGTTLCVSWNNKASFFLESLKSRIHIFEIESNKVIDDCMAKHRERPTWDISKFYQDAHSLSCEDFFSKYTPRTWKVKFSSEIRFLLWKLGIHDRVRRIVQKKRKS